MNFTPNENFFYYLYFIKERMNIFWNRLEGKTPYTNDKIFLEHKFTNVYRVLDRTSQYLLKNVIYNGKEYTKKDMFWRILLFKHFNKNETWEMLINEFGDIRFNNPDIETIGSFLDQKFIAGETLYSNAYMMSGQSGETLDIKRKHLKYFHIFKKYHLNVVDDILESQTMEECFNKFSKLPYSGNFIGYQYTIDWNYSEIFNFSENDFVFPGHGSVRGMKRTFDIENLKGFDFSEIISFISENYDSLVEEWSKKSGVDLRARFLPNRRPTLIDFQNCFCETDKYIRGLGIATDGVHGKRIKNKFRENTERIIYTFPPKWKIENINKDVKNELF